MIEKIQYSRSFKSFYQECKRHESNFADKFQTALELFLKDRSAVYDHAMTKRSLKGLRAFSVTADIRVVYQQTKKRDTLNQGWISSECL